MNRLSRVAVLVGVALGVLVLVPVAPAPAQADPIGGLIVIPGTGNDLTAIRLRTSAGCPAKATAFYATMRGHGFPPDGQIITVNTKAGMSHSFGFDVYVALIMRDYAKDNHTTLGGRYDITVYCVNRLTLQSYGEFTGSLEFINPTTYQAIGAAKPTGPPPPPLALAGDGSALVPAAAAPPAGTPPLAGPPSRAAASQPAPPPTAQTPAGGDPQLSSAAGQLTAQRNDVTGRSVPWLIGVGAVLIVLVVVAVIRKRRSL
jgi:hypothetical protein